MSQSIDQNGSPPTLLGRSMPRKCGIAQVSSGRPDALAAGALHPAVGEWVDADGPGPYASSTIARMHTRRAHGLLVAPAGPQGASHVLLSNVAATVFVNGATYSLATDKFPDIEPTGGYKHVSVFAEDPLPRWEYSVGGYKLEHTLGIVRGQTAVVLRYTWRGPLGAVLEARPLLAMRPADELMSEHGGLINEVRIRSGEAVVRPVASLPTMAFRYQGTFVGSPDWWRRFEYVGDRDRGLSYQEDLWTPGVIRKVLVPDQDVFIVCAMHSLPGDTGEELLQRSAEIAQQGVDTVPPAKAFTQG